MDIATVYLDLAQLAATVVLAMVTGIALAMYVWIIPIIHLAPCTATKIQQFDLNITLGIRYQQQGPRLVVLTLLFLAYLSYNHTDALLQQRWKYYLAAIAILVPMAPYEVYAIFPSNDKLRDWGRKLAQDRLADFGDERDAQTDELLESWRRWHSARFIAPFVATCILIWCAFAT